MKEQATEGRGALCLKEMEPVPRVKDPGLEEVRAAAEVICSAGARARTIAGGLAADSAPAGGRNKVSNAARTGR